MELSGVTIFLILFAVGASLFVLEAFFDFRERAESRVRHVTRNLIFGAVNSGVVGLFYSGVLAASWGISQRVSGQSLFELLTDKIAVPFWIVAVTFFFLFDLILYFWHRANHEISFLWKFHRVHHSDADLDFSSALRFHGGEIIISTIVKGVFVLLTGVPILLIAFFDMLVTLFALYNHANLSMGRAEVFLRKILVTPDMHRVHHSKHVRETNSNYTTMLSFWDKVFGTYTEKSQYRDGLGLKQYESKKSRSFLHLLTMPFRK